MSSLYFEKCHFTCKSTWFNFCPFATFVPTRKYLSKRMCHSRPAIRSENVCISEHIEKKYILDTQVYNLTLAVTQQFGLDF